MSGDGTANYDHANLWDVDPTAPPDCVFFPVRHYSPTSSRLLWQLVGELTPTAVLIEGPSEFNDRIDQLALDDHVLPIAVYTFVRLSDDSKRSAFYPYCEYAPEWQAQQIARHFDIPVRFIDLPWEQMALLTDREHRYSDAQFVENPYPDQLCRRLAVGDFDELWDVLFELDPELDWREYMRRCHEFCYQLRVFGPPEPENEAREEHMFARIQETVAAYGGPVLVVTGGYHSSGLQARLRGERIEHHVIRPAKTAEEAVDDAESAQEVLEILAREQEQQKEPPRVVEAGATLTPFTYERIDKLSGYASGVHGPAFYHYVWDARRRGERLDCSDFLFDIVEALRARGQIASTADVIGIESTARALARVRGREEIWRFDLLDAIGSALVKEAQDVEYGHPILAVARDLMRGERRGLVSDRADLPPLVTNVRRKLHELDLLPTDDERSVRSELDTARGRQESTVLHMCRVLELAGIRFQGGTDFVGRDDLSELWEDWVIAWSPDFEATLIENAAYGSDIEEAANARLLERSRAIERDSEAAALLAVDAVLTGLGGRTAPFFDQLAEIVRTDGDFFNVAKALGHVLYLFGHDEVLGSAGDAGLAVLMRETYLRSLWLFESLGSVKDRNAEIVDGVRAIFDSFRNCYRTQEADLAEFMDIFGRVGRDGDQVPVTRGAALGAMYSVEALEGDDVLFAMRGFSDPMELGDFLVGFFSLAREAAQRDPRLLALLDEIVCGLSEAEFLEVLPGLRLAFTFFTPMEKHRLVDQLFGGRVADEVSISPLDRRAGLELETRLRRVAADFGLRGFDGLPEVEAPPTDVAADETAEAPGAGRVGAGAADAGNGSPTTGGGAAGGGAAAGAAGAAPAGSSGPAAGGTGTGASADEERRERWRLILGAGTEDSMGGLGGGNAQRDRLLAYLYDREYGPGRNVRGGGGKRGNLADSALTVPEWINGVHELFPKRTIERLEKDALDRYEIEEIVTRPDVLSRAQPNATLLKAVLRTKHLMNAEVLSVARVLVRRVVEELMKKLAREVQQPFSGALDRRRRSFLKVAKNFDAAETIRRNLKHWDSGGNRLVIRDPVFYSRIRRQTDQWKVIIVVDQSGSMLDSVIHAAVTASIFCGLRSLQTHLLAFDTNIVDLTSDARDPVETLLGVQLGGGTDIANALEYASGLVEHPARTIIVLVTDFYEGGPLAHLLAATRRLTESGVHLLGLAALDEQANPDYDRQTAAAMVELGAHVGAMTPGELAEWVAEKVR